MERQLRKTVILAKVETTIGTDAAPTGSANALMISNPTYSTDYENVSRDVIRGYMGGSEELAGTRFVTASFECEISSSGTAGTAPAWGLLLLGCAMAEVVSASYVEYTPVSDDHKTLTIYYHKDGVLHKMLRARGNVELGMGEGERPLLKFNFVGVDGGRAATANPAQTLTAWKPPLVITDANSGTITLGGTYADGAVTGGTAYPSRGLNVNLGNDVKKMMVLGNQGVDIKDRSTTGSCQLELTAAQEVAMYADINDNELTSLSFLHGTAAGAKVLIYGPAVQRTNPKDTDYEGRYHLSMDLGFKPLAGNDELRIVAL